MVMHPVEFVLIMVKHPAVVKAQHQIGCDTDYRWKKLIIAHDTMILWGE